MRNPVKILKDRTSPLWWYAAVFFVVQRIGDLINAYLGVFLVPKFIPRAELGAVLPLLQVSLVLGMPIAVISIPFTKALNTFSTKCEFGKVKRLLTDALIFSGIVFAFSALISAIFLPQIIEKMHVENGRLAYFVVITGILGSLVPFFTSALQALKEFDSINVISVLQAPLRFMMMLIALPIRGMTGYFTAQSSVSAFSITAICVKLYRRCFRRIAAAPYTADDRRMFLKWFFPALAGILSLNIQSMAELWTIRQLPDIESAAYYHITRISEIVTYMGGSIIFILFPLVSANYELGKSNRRETRQSVAVTFIIGLFTTVFLLFAGRFIMNTLPVWRDYAYLSDCMAILALTSTLRVSMTCYTTCRMACGDFDYLFYVVPAALCETALLLLVPSVSVSLTGTTLVFLVFAAIPPIAALVMSWRGRRRAAGNVSA